MITYKLSEIYIYPIKSLGGISLSDAMVSDCGLKYDRRWMLIDEKGEFLTQRKLPQMALLQTELISESLKVYHKQSPELNLEIPLSFENAGKLQADIWDDRVNVIEIGESYNEWFSDILKINCRLVYMPDESLRKVDSSYADDNEITSLSDGYPFLIIGQESLNLLNSKLDEPLNINRFRPNFVFTGGKPHDEDEWDTFKINDISFRAVKPCARCVVTTIGQDTAEKSKEPLKTLAQYRTKDNKIMFGQNLLHKGSGTVSVGDIITLTS